MNRLLTKKPTWNVRQRPQSLIVPFLFDDPVGPGINIPVKFRSPQITDDKIIVGITTHIRDSTINGWNYNGIQYTNLTLLELPDWILNLYDIDNQPVLSNCPLMSFATFTDLSGKTKATGLQFLAKNSYIQKTSVAGGVPGVAFCVILEFFYLP